MTLTRPYVKILYNIFLRVLPCQVLSRHLTRGDPCNPVVKCFITPDLIFRRSERTVFAISFSSRNWSGFGTAQGPSELVLPAAHVASL